MPQDRQYCVSVAGDALRTVLGAAAVGPCVCLALEYPACSSCRYFTAIALARNRVIQSPAEHQPAVLHACWKVIQYRSVLLSPADLVLATSRLLVPTGLATSFLCAVNYAQHPLGGYVPNLPLAARDPYRELSRRPASEPLTETDLLSMLPNQRNTRCDLPPCYNLAMRKPP